MQELDSYPGKGAIVKSNSDGEKIKTVLELYESRGSVYLTRGSNQYRQSANGAVWDVIGSIMFVGLLLIVLVSVIGEVVTGHGANVLLSFFFIMPTIVFIHLMNE